MKSELAGIEHGFITVNKNKKHKTEADLLFAA